MADLDLLDLLSEEESSSLSQASKQKAQNQKHQQHQKKLKRTKVLEELGLLEETTTEWIPQETVTLWRRWHCVCGSTYEGPQHDTNPTYVRMEKMRVRYFSMKEEKFIEYKKPISLKNPLSVYRRQNFSQNLPHRVETLDTQLWSCPKCKTTCRTTRELARPWSAGPRSDVEVMDTDAPESHTPKKNIPTYGELNGFKVSPEELTAGYQELGLSDSIEE